jgi:hypothetical protein
VAEPANLFGSLLGEPVNAVSFVMDYVEFHFNGQVIRALSSPILETQSGRFQFPSAGSRDALCSLIEDTVTDVQASEDSSLTLSFSSGARLTVPLDHQSRVGPEAVHFMKDGEFVVIW